jgi:hypothetical protein
MRFIPFVALFVVVHVSSTHFRTHTNIQIQARNQTSTPSSQTVSTSSTVVVNTPETTTTTSAPIVSTTQQTTGKQLNVTISRIQFNNGLTTFAQLIDISPSVISLFDIEVTIHAQRYCTLVTLNEMYSDAGPYQNHHHYKIVQCRSKGQQRAQLCTLSGILWQWMSMRYAYNAYIN